MKILDIPQSGKRGLNVSQAGQFGQISRALAIPANPRTASQMSVRTILSRVDLEPGPGPLPPSPSTVGPLARRRTSLGGGSRSPRTGHTPSLRLGKAAAPTGSQRSNLRPHRQPDRTQTPSLGGPTEETPNQIGRASCRERV